MSMNINPSEICSTGKSIFVLIGWILTVFKIAIPLIIVGLGMFDFGKAVTAGKEDEIKKSAKTVGYRALAGIIIFFVPTIVMWIFGAISDYSGVAGQFDECTNAVLHPWQ